MSKIKLGDLIERIIDLRLSLAHEDNRFAVQRKQEKLDLLVQVANVIEVGNE